MIQWMGHAFTASDYVFWTRIECSAWTLADLLIVLYLIRMANLARRQCGVRLHSVSLGVLLATLPPSASIPFMTSGTWIFLLELAVTIPHFVLILYVLISDARHFAGALSQLVHCADGEM